MIQMRSYKIELKLNNEQRILCAKSAGVSRYAYNWMLEKLSNEYEANKALATMYGLSKVPSTMGSAIDWHKEWCQLKKSKEWIYEVSKCAGQEALRDLQIAYSRFFKQTGGYPKKKKKGSHDSFRVTGSVYVGFDFVQIPGIGKVRLKEHGYAVQTKTALSQATVSRTADRWFVSFLIKTDVPEIIKPSMDEITDDEYDVVGIDLGIKDLAITSYGEVFHNPKAYKSKLRKLKRYQRMVSRKQTGSNNKKNAIERLSRVHKQVADIRNDACHKMTTSVVKTKPKMIVIESLKPKNMSRNRKLASAVLDSAFGKIAEQFAYKSEWAGIHLIKAHPFYASSKYCSTCGRKNNDLTLADREWTCTCGACHDRDVNAAINLRFYGLWFLNLNTESSPEINACSNTESSGDWSLLLRDERLQFLTEQCSSMKQEFNYAINALRA